MQAKSRVTVSQLLFQYCKRSFLGTSTHHSLSFDETVPKIGSPDHVNPRLFSSPKMDLTHWVMIIVSKSKDAGCCVRAHGHARKYIRCLLYLRTLTRKLHQKSTVLRFVAGSFGVVVFCSLSEFQCAVGALTCHGNDTISCSLCQLSHHRLNPGPCMKHCVFCSVLQWVATLVPVWINDVVQLHFACTSIFKSSLPFLKSSLPFLLCVTLPSVNPFPSPDSMTGNRTQNHVSGWCIHSKERAETEWLGVSLDS